MKPKSDETGKLEACPTLKIWASNPGDIILFGEGWMNQLAVSGADRAGMTHALVTDMNSVQRTFL